MTQNEIVYYSSILKDNPFWYFYIPLMEEELSSPYVLEDVQHRILEFNQDYLKISFEYGMAQLLSPEFVKLTEINLFELYRKHQLSQFEEWGLTSVLPQIGNKYYEKVIYANFQSTRLSLPNANEQIVAREIYDLNGFKNMKDIINDKKRIDYPVISIFSDESFIQGNEDPFTTRDFPLYLNVQIRSNLFFQTLDSFVSYKKEKWMKKKDFKGIDNTFLAYRNTPRFNSFLRDLIDIWCNKYGWKLETPDYIDSNSNYRKEGIVLDGKIIYQEDIDSGRVQLPLE